MANTSIWAQLRSLTAIRKRKLTAKVKVIREGVNERVTNRRRRKKAVQ